MYYSIKAIVLYLGISIGVFFGGIWADYFHVSPKSRIGVLASSQIVSGLFWMLNHYSVEKYGDMVGENLGNIENFDYTHAYSQRDRSRYIMWKYTQKISWIFFSTFIVVAFILRAIWPGVLFTVLLELGPKSHRIMVGDGGTEWDTDGTNF